MLCSLFFIIGINLFLGKKVFSVSRNLKYLLVGLPLISVTASVLLGEQAFAWGGAVGDLCKDYLFKTIGKFGTIAVLAVAFLAYIIWRFNPSFKLPEKKTLVAEDDGEIELPAGSMEEIETPEEKIKAANAMKGTGKMGEVPDQSPAFNHELTIVEREETEDKKSGREKEELSVPFVDTMDEKDILPASLPQKKLPVVLPDTTALELEIKTADEIAAEEDLPMTAEKVQQLKPYDPVLDLRDYKFPSLDLLENHGSEKIVQDPAELENNKNQIIGTLRNYDIEIQKIYATVGPTVTLYEIVPAPGVRISRIKNLEDDIAL
jgi:S-DNA-T family DNA segregation ATPase FtsK/SpoIIIE